MFLQLVHLPHWVDSSEIPALLSVKAIHLPSVFNSANLPFLDLVGRYPRTVEAAKNADDYPTVDNITSGMGEMLGRLHWLASYDGRDIEFVMGGAVFGITKSPVRNSISASQGNG